MGTETFKFKIVEQSAILFSQWLAKKGYEFSESLGGVWCNGDENVHTAEYLFNKFIKDEFVDENLITDDDEKKISITIEMDNPSIYQFLIDAGVSLVSTGSHYIFLINKVGYKFPIMNQGTEPSTERRNEI